MILEARYWGRINKCLSQVSRCGFRGGEVSHSVGRRGRGGYLDYWQSVCRVSMTKYTSRTCYGEASNHKAKTFYEPFCISGWRIPYIFLFRVWRGLWRVWRLPPPNILIIIPRQVLCGSHWSDPSLNIRWLMIHSDPRWLVNITIKLKLNIRFYATLLHWHT